MNRGILFNIQRYTIHDGPGIRTELFLKGCPLSCQWCGNPEGRARHIQPGVYEKKCLGMERCGLCMESCGCGDALVFQDVTPEAQKKRDVSVYRLTSIDRSLCIGCMKCAESCPGDAIKQWGVEMTVSEIMETIRKDIPYYESSGGGVTISGGEPLLQADFVTEILKQCKKETIHTCLESTFCMEWRIIERAMPYTDMMITDIKHMDPEIHQQYTGMSNGQILENLRRISALEKPLIIRIPVVPGVNDNQSNMTATADFILEEMGGHMTQMQLLPFMRLGEEKYASLGMPYLMVEPELDRETFQERIKAFAAYFKSRGIPCLVGTKETE